MSKFTRKKKRHRRFPRRSASSHVKITCHKKEWSAGGPDLIAAVLDLSQAGARLLVRAPLDVGEEVVLGLVGPAIHAPLTRHGKVMWSFPVTDHSYAAGVCLEEHLAREDVQEATIHPVRLDY